MRFSRIFSKILYHLKPIPITYREYSWYKPTVGDEVFFKEVNGRYMTDSERLRRAKLAKRRAKREGTYRKDQGRFW